MTCPECRVYPINEKSKHKLCIKCGYEVARVLAKQRRQANKDVLADRECPSCKKMFPPKYKDHKFCGIECQKTLPNKMRNAAWMTKKRKSFSSKNAVQLRITRRKSNFNKFETKQNEI